MTRGTIAGILLTGMILGKENYWSSLYDPSCKTNENIIIVTIVMMSSENINLDSTSKEQRSKGRGEKKKKHQNISGRDFYQPGQDNRRIRKKR
jgi:hypothetical protein